MEIKQIQAIEGANVYSYRPIIRAIVDLQEWVERTSDTLGDFNQRLLDCLPTLAEHHCAKGRPGGFVERLQEGTLVGHIIEHVAIDLLTQAGQTIKYGKTEATLRVPGEYEIIFNYESKEGAMEAFCQAFDLVSNLLRKEDVDVESALVSVKNAIRTYEPGVSTGLILQACAKRGIPVKMVSGSLLQLGYGRYQRRLQAAMSDRTGCISVDIACDKGLTKELLCQAGVPVPFGYVVKQEKEAVEAFKNIGRSVVIKPYNGNQGKGVTLRLNTEKEIRSAFRVAQTYGEEVIVEEHINGRHFRILIIDGVLAAAAERIPAHVRGDGVSSIEKLIHEANRDPRRGEDHEKALTKIKVDPVVLLSLKQKNLNLETIPHKDEIVYLRDSANLSTGGIARDVTDQVHPDNRDLAIYAVRTIGLDIAGVDLVMEDISQSYREKGGYIIEINAAPGLRMHWHPTYGKGRDVGQMIVDYLFPVGNGRIPIISVTGTNGKTTTVRALGRMLADQHMAVGMTTTDGVYINNRLLVAGDMSGPESAKMVLGHPDVQVAVLETARGGILRGGLAYDYADVAVITNVSEDHLGQYGIETVEEIAHVKSLVAEVVKPYSYVVLNADDPLVLRMAGKTSARVILFTTQENNRYVCRHLGFGGVAVMVRKGYIVICRGAESHRVCPIRNIPLTLEGRARHNIQNVLGAVGAGWALGLSPTAMARSLRNFYSNEQDNKGRLNFYDINGVKVCIDYGHNPAGIREIIRTLRQFPNKGLVGCITVPGDRPDTTVQEVGRIAASGFDRIVIREDEDLRGREAGEIAAMIKDQAVASGMGEEKISVVLPELEAFVYGLDHCEPGEFFVMFYEHLQPIEEEIERRLALESAKNGKDNIIKAAVRTGS